MILPTFGGHGYLAFEVFTQKYAGDIFGRQFTVIDHIERLPERLPQLFMALTK